MTKRLFAALLPLAFSVAAQAAPHGILWADGRRPPNTSVTGDLQYYGGPIIPNARVYAVFWGDAVPAETKTKIGPFLENMLDSTYMDWLSEYDTNLRAVDGRPGTAQHIGRGTFGGNVTIKPANASVNLSDADVQGELEGQIAAGKLPSPDANSLYMLYFPSGVSITIEGMRSCSSFCAYHEGFMGKAGAPIYYGVMPVCGGFGCGGGFKGLTATSSHEAVEAITDPFPTPGDKPAYPQAWNTAGGEEISDLCQSVSGTVTGHGITSTVSGQWDNRTHKCLTGPWAQSLAEERVLQSRPLDLAFRPAWALPKAW